MATAERHGNLIPGGRRRRVGVARSPRRPAEDIEILGDAAARDARDELRQPARVVATDASTGGAKEGNLFRRPAGGRPAGRKHRRPHPRVVAALDAPARRRAHRPVEGARPLCARNRRRRGGRHRRDAAAHAGTADDGGAAAAAAATATAAAAIAAADGERADNVFQDAAAATAAAAAGAAVALAIAGGGRPPRASTRRGCTTIVAACSPPPTPPLPATAPGMSVSPPSRSAATAVMRDGSGGASMGAAGRNASSGTSPAGPCARHA